MLLWMRFCWWAFVKWVIWWLRHRVALEWMNSNVWRISARKKSENIYFTHIFASCSFFFHHNQWVISAKKKYSNFHWLLHHVSDRQEVSESKLHHIMWLQISIQWIFLFNESILKRIYWMVYSSCSKSIKFCMHVQIELTTMIDVSNVSANVYVYAKKEVIQMFAMTMFSRLLVNMIVTMELLAFHFMITYLLDTSNN